MSELAIVIGETMRQRFSLSLSLSLSLYLYFFAPFEVVTMCCCYDLVALNGKQKVTWLWLLFNVLYLTRHFVTLPLWHRKQEKKRVFCRSPNYTFTQFIILWVPVFQKLPRAQNCSLSSQRQYSYIPKSVI